MFLIRRIEEEKTRATTKREQHTESSVNIFKNYTSKIFFKLTIKSDDLLLSQFLDYGVTNLSLSYKDLGE